MRVSSATPLQMRGKLFGGPEGLFCVPLVAASHDDLLMQARNVAALQPDVVEWRSDSYSDLGPAAIAEASKGLRSILFDALLLFTLRAKVEGGHRELDEDERGRCIERALASRAFDLVDVELSSGPPVIKRVLEAARASGARMILSFHDFEKTPDSDALLTTIAAMIYNGADVAKIACMPRDASDALRLLDVTLAARRRFPNVALSTTSMGAMGCLTRVAGFLYGSDMAFAVGDKASASGQIPLQEARQIASTLLKYA